VRGAAEPCPELVCIIDSATGDLVVAGLEGEEAVVLAGDLMHDEADLGKKIECPLLVRWSQKGPFHRMYDVLPNMAGSRRPGAGQG
jgi:hypothetical protein